MSKKKRRRLGSGDDRPRGKAQGELLHAVLDELEAQGVTTRRIRRTTNDHLLVTWDDGGYVSISHSPGDHMVRVATIASVRRTCRQSRN